MKNREVFRHEGFAYGEPTYGLLFGVLISVPAMELIETIISVQASWLPMLILIIIFSVILTWVFKQITNRKHIILDEVGITITPIFGKAKRFEWDQVSHLVLTGDDQNDFFATSPESRLYLDDGSYATFNTVSLPTLKAEEGSGLLSGMMNRDLAIIDYEALKDMRFGKTLLAFAPHVMKQTEVMAQAKKQKMLEK